jgi:hypothetical protein
MSGTDAVTTSRPGQPPGRRTRASIARRSVVLALPLLLAALLAGSLVPRSAAVVNGSPDSPAPSWAVGLVGSVGTCSGALIAQNLVLSASHCQRDLQGDIHAVIGRANLLDDTSGTVVAVSSVTRHPSEDLAVYRLAQRVSQRPIPISRTHIGAASRNIPFTFHGYGIQSEPTQPMKWNYLLYSTVGLVASCAGTGISLILAPKVCLVSVKIGAPCRGDSGGPVVTPNGDLAGIFIGNLGTVAGHGVCDGSQWITEPMADAGINDWVSTAIQQSTA